MRYFVLTGLLLAILSFPTASAGPVGVDGCASYEHFGQVRYSFGGCRPVAFSCDSNDPAFARVCATPWAIGACVDDWCTEVKILWNPNEDPREFADGVV